MKFCDERIQRHLLNGGKIKKSDKGIWKYCPILINEDNVLVFADTEEYYTLSKRDLTTDDWEIVEPKYDWNKIIEDKVLCVFSQQKNFDHKIISTVSEKHEDNDGYLTSQGVWYSHCKPFNPADFNIAKNLKKYEK